MHPQKTRFVLIRHGEVDNPKQIIYGRHLNVPLTHGGYRQMVGLALAIKSLEIKPDLIYSSPLRRAVQSVAALHTVFPGTPVESTDNLLEADHDVLTGKPLAWLGAEGANLYNLPKLQGKIEDPEQMAQRVIVILEMATGIHPGKTIFVVSHGDPLAYAVWRLRFPKQPFPSRQVLRKTSYLGKGEAWLIESNATRTITEPKLIVTY